MVAFSLRTLGFQPKRVDVQTYFLHNKKRCQNHVGGKHAVAGAPVPTVDSEFFVLGVVALGVEGTAADVP